MATTGRTVGGVAAFVGLAAGITGVVLAVGSEDVAAVELERFASCAELETWATEATESIVGQDVATEERLAAEGEGDAAAPQAAEESGTPTEDAGAGAGDDGTGGTNTVVAGVDEIDVIDRVGDDRLLVARNGALALVDLDGRAVSDHLEGLPYDARISVDDDLVWVAGTTNDAATAVLRVRVDGDQLVTEASWTTPGYLLDARRTGDRLHVVTVDHGEAGVVPFEDGPVPCDEVWRPTAAPTTPAATLVATLPADGELVPTAAVEVTGAAGNLLVTDDSVFIATETWAEQGGITTGVHRFTLDGLQLTGSGSVPGTVAGPFALNEHEGHLRVATSAGSGFGIAVDVGAPEGDAVRVDPATQSTGALAEVFVLDADSLALVGASGRFGHDGETIHGVRFVGDVAYVVTFLQTDPFWVIDLSNPSAPRAVGELEIPGFSAYLHPAGDGRAVGFGPDADGRMAARLFDATDPTNPVLVDELLLGDDTPVAWDHHAYVGLDDGRFAVPVSDYPDVVSERCTEVPPEQTQPGQAQPNEPPPDQPVTDEPVEVVPPTQICEPVYEGGFTGVVELAVEGNRLVEVDRAGVEMGEEWYTAERAVLAGDGTWLLLTWDRLLPTDGGAAVVLPSDPSAGGGVIID
jgi:uncharacterized secreted protein with C-terminal beta-propeller domain